MDKAYIPGLIGKGTLNGKPIAEDFTAAFVVLCAVCKGIVWSDKSDPTCTCG